MSCLSILQEENWLISKYWHGNVNNRMRDWLLAALLHSLLKESYKVDFDATLINFLTFWMLSFSFYKIWLNCSLSSCFSFIFSMNFRTNRIWMNITSYNILWNKTENETPKKQFSWHFFHLNSKCIFYSARQSCF